MVLKIVALFSLLWILRLYRQRQQERRQIATTKQRPEIAAAVNFLQKLLNASEVFVDDLTTIMATSYVKYGVYPDLNWDNHPYGALYRACRSLPRKQLLWPTPLKMAVVTTVEEVTVIHYGQKDEVIWTAGQAPTPVIPMVAVGTVD